MPWSWDAPGTIPPGPSGLPLGTRFSLCIERTWYRPGCGGYQNGDGRGVMSVSAIMSYSLVYVSESSSCSWCEDLRRGLA